MGRQLGLFCLSLLWLATAGCGPAAPPPIETVDRPADAAPIRLLVVDDAELAEAIGRQWNAHDERRLVVEQMASSELAGAAGLNADAVIYPSGLLGELAESRRIVPFPADALDGPQLARGDLFPLQLQVEGRWGGQLLAVPLGSPQFCLVYRRDLVPAVGERPPATWAQYYELASRLAEANSQAGDGSFHAVAEPLAAGWAGQVLLARAAAYARHRSQYSTLFNFNTMEPLIAGPPFVRALEELVAASRLAPPECLEWTPAEVLEAVRSGRVAMALTWPQPAGTGIQPADSAPVATGDPPMDSAAAPSSQLAFAELPGSDQVYSLGQQRWEPRREDESGRIRLLAIAGRLGSVTAQSRRPAAAADALAWITGRDWSPLIAPASRATTMYRQSHREQPERWIGSAAGPAGGSGAASGAGAAAEYGELVERLQSGSDVLFSVRIPGRARYLEALDEAVRAAVRGEATAADALTAAADRWRQITSDLGLDAQRSAYARSLGLEP